RVIGEGDPGGLLGDAIDAPFDLVIETVGGTADTLDTAVAACRPGGTICVLGAFTRSPPFPALFVLVKELRIVGSLAYGRAGARIRARSWRRSRAAGPRSGGSRNARSTSADRW